jgi:hypothetical protein
VIWLDGEMAEGRIEAARRRARAAKRAIALSAAAAFAVVLALARQGHPGAGVPAISGGPNGVGPSTASSSQSHDGDDDGEHDDDGSLLGALVGGLLAPSSSESTPAGSHTS